MTFFQLECFMVLAQRLNFTQAAAELFIAQPALSRIISSLERELKVQLFERTPRSVTLTPAGKAFLSQCPTVLESYRNCVSAAHLAQKGLNGSLTLGILRDNFEPCLPQLFKTFHNHFPQIALSLRGYSHSGLLAAFEFGEVDAILNYLQIPAAAENEELIVLHRNRQCVITALDHPLAQRSSLRMAELKDEPFVVMTRTDSTPGHDFIWQIAAEAGFTPQIVEEATHIPILITLVACGVGISTLTEDLKYLAQGKVAFIPLLGVPLSNLVFTWHSNHTNPALPHLIQTVRSQAEGESCGS